MVRADFTLAVFERNGTSWRNLHFIVLVADFTTKFVGLQPLLPDLNIKERGETVRVGEQPTGAHTVLHFGARFQTYPAYPLLGLGKRLHADRPISGLLGNLQLGSARVVKVNGVQRF